MIICRLQKSFPSDTDAAAGAAATNAASAAATVASIVKTIVKTKAVAEAAAPATSPAAASVSEEKDSWSLSIVNVLVFAKLIFAGGVQTQDACHISSMLCLAMVTQHISKRT